MKSIRPVGVFVLFAALASSALAAEPVPSREFAEVKSKVLPLYNETQHPYTRAQIVLDMKTFDEPAFVEFLVDLVVPTADKRYTYIIRQAIAEKIAELAKPETLAYAVERGLGSPRPHVRAVFAYGFALSKSPLATDGLLKALEDAEADVRAAAVRGAGKVRDPRIVPVLINLMGPANRDFLLDTYNALVDVTGCQLRPEQASWQKWWDENKDKIKTLPLPEGERVTEKVFSWPLVTDQSYECRSSSGRAKALGAYANPKFRAGNIKAVEAGLKWLAAHQAEDGCWDPEEFWKIDPEYAGMTLEELQKKAEGTLFVDARVDPGVGQKNMQLPCTGFALMAFVGAGYTHRSGKYVKNVQAAIDWLVAKQDKNTGRFSGNMYVQGICSHAVIELWGMTRDLKLREPAQRAVDYLCWAQGERGGWDYGPRSKLGDSSVSSWCTMAMQTANRSNLHVPARNIVWTRDFWDKVTVFTAQEGGKEFGQAFYKLDENGQHQGGGTHANTAASILCRIFMGTQHRARSVKAGAVYLESASPGSGGNNVYMWYYATQALFQMGGKQWEDWENDVMPAVLNMQVQPKPGKPSSADGSFYAKDAWLQKPLGRPGLTAACCIILETYYFYPKIKNE